MKTTADGRSRVIADPSVRRALAIGSPSLLEAVERTPADDKKIARVMAKLRRFLVRMSTRPTPFGTFAGVALSSWANRTDIAIDGIARTRTRIDMEWLVQYILALEAQPAIRNQLRWVASSAAWIRGDRVMLSGSASHYGGGLASGASIAATPIVRQVLDLARTPIAYTALADRLIQTKPSATAQKVNHLLQQMWELGFLRTELMPPMTTETPIEWVSERLAPISGGKALCVQLNGLVNSVGACDLAAMDTVEEVQHRAVVHADLIKPTQAKMPLQVDMALGCRGSHVTSLVADEAARTADLLLRLSPMPNGPPYLANFRQAFVARYGSEREVPLLEMLHPEFGLGPIAFRGFSGGAESPRAAQRVQTLQHLALRAIREAQLVVELDENTLARLETRTNDSARLPASIDLNLFVLATSASAMDKGDFELLVGPNLGAPAAGRNLARFAYLLGSSARGALEAAARYDESRDPKTIVAELCYLPRNFRSANVTLRPPVRLYEIAHEVSPGVPFDRVIPLNELVVGIRQDRFYVRWPSRGVDVQFASGHMLNWMQAPAECQFLSEVGRDGVTQLSAFDWGPAGGYIFLPRVQSGKSILHCAQWRLDSFAQIGEAPLEAAHSFANWFAHWRERWCVPDHVYLSMADNRLLYDLGDLEQVDDLRAELRRAHQGGQCLLQEALPGPEHAWLASTDGGHHVVELVVSLGLRSMPSKVEAVAAAPQTRSTPLPITPDIRLRMPGSDWLYVKLYGPRSGMDEFVAGPMREFCKQIEEARTADDWFFVRYADPEPHIRLRFRGSSPQLLSVLLPRLCVWSAQLSTDGFCHRFAFDTYEREVERYGGPEGATLSEAIFAADSRAIVRLLDIARGADRLLLAVATADDLLRSLGLSQSEQIKWLTQMVPRRGEFGDEYRARQEDLIAVLRDPTKLGDLNGVLRDRRDAVAEAARALAELERDGRLTQPISKLYASYFHMHCNRLLGEPSADTRILCLLLRTCDAIAHLQKALSANV